MILRKAQQRDASAICGIWNREIREGVSTFNATEKSETEIGALILERGEAFAVAERNGQVVGFATYSQFRGGVGYGRTMEHTLYLDDTARGQGIGRALMQRMEETARGAGVHVLVAGVGSENVAGIRFHAALGFREVARMPEVGRKFGRWMDLVLMQKIL